MGIIDKNIGGIAHTHFLSLQHTFHTLNSERPRLSSIKLSPTSKQSAVDSVRVLSATADILIK